MNKKICYCFEYTEDDIIRDLNRNDGVSTILDKITKAKKQGNCNCKDKHPEHR